MQPSDSVDLAQLGKNLKLKRFVNSVFIKVYGKTGICVHGAMCSFYLAVMLFSSGMHLMQFLCFRTKCKAEFIGFNSVLSL